MIVNSKKKPRRIRCAIYARKSTSDGLEQEFNSLDAQRDAALAYIASQGPAGWRALEKPYDDGGYSGGNTDRPALVELLADIRRGEVDCVVVQRVDRLSRSLLDFARLMEIFDQYEVSFVSVTQQINSATSMGRLILNVLLSFAQFERELIAERTADKMGAARRRGRWLGGTPVLGYDVDPHSGQLVVNPSEAQRVQDIFRLYLDYGSLTITVRELEKRGWLSKRWTSRAGRRRGGRPFRKGTLHVLLTNITYCGQLRYRGEVFSGLHESIISDELFMSVAEHLRRHRTGHPPRKSSHGRGWLQGLLYCHHCGKPLRHATVDDSNRRWRCYFCPRVDGEPCTAHRLPAAQMERAVFEQLWRPSEEATADPRELIDRVEYDPNSSEIVIHRKPLNTDT